MTNCNSDPSPQRVLDDLRDLLNEERISNEIAYPIDRVVATFQMKVMLPITHLKFNGIISAFVRDLYKRGLRLSMDLTREKAFIEAVSLFEKHYRNQGATGYDGALYDATGANAEGLNLVLVRLAEAIKSSEREKYVKWVFAGRFSHLDWNLKIRIVSFFLKQNEAILPKELRNTDPGRFVDDFQDLFTSSMSDENIIKQGIRN